MSHTLSRSTDSLSATGIYNGYIEQVGEQYSDNEDSINELAQPIFSNADDQYAYEPIPQQRVAVPENEIIYLSAQNLFLELKSAAPEVQLAVKQLMKKELASINPKISINSSQHKVQPKITEGDFNQRYTSIATLLTATQLLKNKAVTRVNLIAGKATTLNKNDPDYGNQKIEAAKLFNDYEALYNNAVDVLVKMSKEEEGINSLQELTNETIDQFIKENNLRLKHFSKQFDTLYSEHGFVDERVKTGYESTRSRVLGVTSNVMLPEKKEAAKDLTQSQLDLSNDFSPLFTEINENYYSLKAFGDKVQSHLANVAGIRKAWDENHPEFSDFKDSASFLPKKYEPLAKECSDVYETLSLHNEKLNSLKAALTMKLEERSKEIHAARDLLIETFGKYVTKSKELDMVINNNTLTVCKDIRILKATTTEKYPTKEKEEKKENKDI